MHRKVGRFKKECMGPDFVNRIGGVALGFHTLLMGEIVKSKTEYNANIYKAALAALSLRF